MDAKNMRKCRYWTDTKFRQQRAEVKNFNDFTLQFRYLFFFFIIIYV